MKKHFLFFPALLACFALPGDLFSQNDLRQDEAFFKKQLKEFAIWLQSTGLDAVFHVERMDVEREKVTLFLTGTVGDLDCDTLKNAWLTWKDEFFFLHGCQLHEKMLETWAFLLEVPKGSAEIILHCPTSYAFRVRIFFDPQTGLIQTEEDILRTGKEFEIPFSHLRNIYVCGKLDSLGRLKTVLRVRLAIANYIKKRYEDKGTFFLNVKMDTSRSYRNSFSFEFTQFKNEVLDNNYFEYHKVDVDVREENKNIRVKWQFQGKWGSGMVFAPRKNDYKPMETYYPAELEKYEHDLFTKIQEHLLNQP